MKKLTNEADLIKMLKETYGEFESYVENVYLKTIINKIMKSNVDEVRLWLTLNEIITQFKINKEDKTTKNLQYLITEKNINKVEILLILDYNNLINNNEITRLKNKLIKLWSF